VCLLYDPEPDSGIERRIEGHVPEGRQGEAVQPRSSGSGDHRLDESSPQPLASMLGHHIDLSQMGFVLVEIEQAKPTARSCSSAATSRRPWLQSRGAFSSDEWGDPRQQAAPRRRAAEQRDVRSPAPSEARRSARRVWNSCPSRRPAIQSVRTLLWGDATSSLRDAGQMGSRVGERVKPMESVRPASTTTTLGEPGQKRERFTPVREAALVTRDLVRDGVAGEGLRKGRAGPREDWRGGRTRTPSVSEEKRERFTPVREAALVTRDLVRDGVAGEGLRKGRAGPREDWRVDGTRTPSVSEEKRERFTPVREAALVNPRPGTRRGRG